MADPDELFYEFKDTEPVTLKDDMYAKMSVEDRQRAWESGLRPVNEAWQIVYPDERRRRYEFINKGRVSELRYSGNKTPKDLWTKEDRAKERRAKEFQFQGGKEAAPLPWHRKDHNSATKLMNTIQWFRDNPEKVGKGNFTDIMMGTVKRLPFTFGVGEITDAVIKGKSIDRIYEGNAEPADYYGVAKDIVYAEMQEDDPRAMKVFRGVSELPAYAADIALTGGIGGGTRAIGRQGLAILAKRLGKEKFKKFMASAVVRGAVKAAPAVTEAGIYAGVTDVGGTLAQALPQRDLKYDESTETGFAATEKDSWMNSLPKAVVNQMSEYLVEKVGGEALAKGASKIGAPIRKAMTPKPTSADVPENMKTYILNRIRQSWQRANPDAGPIASRIGFNGMIAELGEERVTEIVQGANEVFFSQMPGYNRDAAPQIDQSFGLTGDVAQEAGYQLGVTDETPEQASQRRDDMLTQGLTEAVGIGAMKGMAGGRATPTPAVEDFEKTPIGAILTVQIENNEGFRNDVASLVKEGKDSRSSFAQIPVPDSDKNLLELMPNKQARQQFLKLAEDYLSTSAKMEAKQGAAQQQPPIQPDPIQPAPAQPAPVQPEAEQPAPEAQQPIQPEQQQPVTVKQDTVEEQQQDVLPQVEQTEAQQEETKLQKKAVGNIAVRDIRRAFPGINVKEVDEGFQLDLSTGSVLIRLSETADITDSQLQQLYKDYSTTVEGFTQQFPTAEQYITDYRAKEAQGQFSAGLIRPPTKEQAAELNLLAVVDLNNTDWAKANANQVKVLKHEMVHFAFNTGMWNKAERDALIKQYSDPNKSFREQSEDIALYAELWEDQGMVQRIKNWINRILSKLTGGKVELSSKAAEQLFKSEDFWQARSAEQMDVFMGKQQNITQGMPVSRINTFEGIDNFSDPHQFTLEGGKLEAVANEWADTDYSVLSTFVDEDKRRQGIATRLVQEMRDTLKGSIGAQVSSENSLNLFWKQGFRMPDGGTKADALAELKEMSSVNLVHPGKTEIGSTPIQGMPDKNYTRPTGENYASQQQTRTGQLAQEQGTQAGELRERGSLPRGSEQLSSKNRATIEKPALEGLPTNIKLKAYPDAKIGPSKIARTAAAVYAERSGIDYNPPSTYQKVDKQRAARIADWYESAEHIPNDPAVAKSYRAMMDETLAQWLVIKETGLQVEWITEEMLEKAGDPYSESPRLATEDIRRNNHFYVFPTDLGFGSDADFDPAQNPLFELTDEIIAGKQARYNDIFRIVHDYFGHVKEGNGFRAFGEENAWRSHVAMYSPLARPAMTMETRGQNSWVNYGPHGDFNKTASGEDTVYADQKINIPPAWINEEGATDPIIQGSPYRYANRQGNEAAREAVEDLNEQYDPQRIKVQNELDKIEKERARNPNADIELMQRLEEGSIDPRDVLHADQLKDGIFNGGPVSLKQMAEFHKINLLQRKAGTQTAQTLAMFKEVNRNRKTDVQVRLDAITEGMLSVDEKTEELLSSIPEKLGEDFVVPDAQQPPQPDAETPVQPDAQQPPQTETQQQTSADGDMLDPSTPMPDQKLIGREAYQALLKERKRLQKITEFIEKLGYDTTTAGLQRLARDLESSVKVVDFINKTKRHKVRQLADVISEYRYAAMLSGPETQMVNAFSNATFSTWRELEQVMWAAANSTAGIFGKADPHQLQLRDYKQYGAAGITNALGSAFKHAFGAWANEWHGWHKNKLIEDKTGTDFKSKIEMEHSLPGRVRGKIRSVLGFGPMHMVDQFFKTLNAHMHVGVQAAMIARNTKDRGGLSEAELIEDLVANKQSPAWKRAMNEASLRMFQDTGKGASKVLIEAGDKLRTDTAGGFLVRHTIAPFVRTPVRITSQALVRLPGMPMLLPYKIVRNLLDGKPALKGVGSEAVSQVASTIIFALLLGLRNSEDEEEQVLTGAAKGHDSRERTYRYGKGVNPVMAMKLGDEWVSYDRQDPLAIIGATTIDGVDAIKKGEPTILGRSLAGQLHEKTFLRGISDLYTGITEEKGGKRWAASMIGSFIPKLWGQTTRKFDPYVRDKDVDTIGKQALQRENVLDAPVIYDQWGFPAERSNDAKSLIGMRSKSAERFAGNRVIDNWNRLNPDDKTLTTPPRDTYTPTGKTERKMDRDGQYQEFRKVSGTLTREVVLKAIPPEMQREPSPVVLKITKNALEEARNNVKAHYERNVNFDIDMDRQVRIVLAKVVSSATKIPKRPIRSNADTDEYALKDTKHWEAYKDAAIEYRKWYSQNRSKIRR